MDLRTPPRDAFSAGAPDDIRRVGYAAEKLAPPDRPVVASQAMLQVFSALERVAASVVPVLILGETGTGKEVVARTVHESSARSSSPFVCVNCGGLTESLVEATLFGHEKGSFTGAADRKRGVFEAANGGTVFLDEIGELPTSAQAALLRVLEAKRVTRVGSVEEVPVDVRILAATHRDLEAMCTRGEFRWDLYYRLNVFTLHLPPLRSRTEDIGPLAERFLNSAAAQNGRTIEGITDRALDRLRAHDWPGNVRELKNVVDRAVVLASSSWLDLGDLPDNLQKLDVVPPPSSLGDALEELSTVDLEAAPTNLHPKPSTPDDGSEASPPGYACGGSDVSVEPEASERTEDLGQQGPLLDYKTQMFYAERRVLLNALEMSELNQTEAARLLQMPLRTLVHKIKTLGLRDEINRLKAGRKR